MDRRGALVASHATLADLAGVSISTIKRAIADLVSGAWIQTVRIGSERGGALAYVTRYANRGCCSSPGARGTNMTENLVLEQLRILRSDLRVRKLGELA